MTDKALQDSANENTEQAATEAPASGSTPSTEGTSEQPAADDWRMRYAGGDADEAKTLAKFADETAFFKAHRDLEAAYTRRGTYLPVDPGKDASKEQRQAYEAQVAKYREAIGVPKEASGYDIDLGKDASEHDGVLLDLMRTEAHTAGYTKEQFRAGMEMLKKAEAVNKQHMEAVADQANKDTERQLKSLWGRDFEKNKQALGALIGDAGLGDDFLDKRLQDGTPVGSYLPLIKYMTDQALARLDDGDLVIGNVAVSGESDEARYKELMALMRTDEDKYYSDPVQRELDDLRNRINRRNERAAARSN